MTRHGHASDGRRTPTYNSWRAMIYRCTYARHPFYLDYGGRGITVCDSWRTFANFLDDMGVRPSGMTLERVDVDGNYEPGNVIWADNYVQRWNRRDMSARLEEYQYELALSTPTRNDDIPF